MLIKRLAALGSRISKTKSLLAKKAKSPFQRGVMLPGAGAKSRAMIERKYKNVTLPGAGTGTNYTKALRTSPIVLPSKFDRVMSETKYKVGQHLKKRGRRYGIGMATGGAVAGGLAYQKVRRSRKER